MVALTTLSPPLQPFERSLAGGLAAVLAVTILWLFLLQVSSTRTMLEYVFKFLPAMTDGWLAAIFDGNTIGHPRPRLLTAVLTYVSIALRQRQRAPAPAWQPSRCSPASTFVRWRRW
jgi:hypothetical protein